TRRGASPGRRLRGTQDERSSYTAPDPSARSRAAHLRRGEPPSARYGSLPGRVAGGRAPGRSRPRGERRGGFAGGAGPEVGGSIRLRAGGGGVPDRGAGARVVARSPQLGGGEGTPRRSHRPLPARAGARARSGRRRLGPGPRGAAGHLRDGALLREVPPR